MSTVTLHLPKKGDFECLTGDLDYFLQYSYRHLMREASELTKWPNEELARFSITELAIIVASLDGK